MDYLATSSDPVKLRTQCLVLGISQGGKLSARGQNIDNATSGLIRQVIKSRDISGKAGETLLLPCCDGIQAKRLLLIGVGRQKDFDQAQAECFAQQAVKATRETAATELALCLGDLLAADESSYLAFRSAVIAADSALYQFNQCKAENKDPLIKLTRLNLLSVDGRQIRIANRAVDHAVAMAAGIKLTRDLSNLPGNICTPGYLAGQASAMKKEFRKLQVEILEESDMQKLGMGALLSVSRGSREAAKLITLNYRGAKAKDKPLVLVGKGLTFDAGGISIKPSAAMDEMKYDMCGGASVFGVMRAVVQMKLPINLIGVVPSSENLPDGDANKPGDIVTSMSGQSIEILNTDAEGRLILCDALTYCERFNPAAVIDIATLTGACVIALGKHASGLMSNHEPLAREILAAGENSGDRVWQLPLWDDYEKQLKSNFADMANIGGREGGAITAACFLSKFTRKQKWAHLDIAGTAWKSGAEKGATGRPVSLLIQFLLRRCKLDH
ncbi:MAG: leucyl aminopeptidase [gamma proteobacterium symbiont of Bathyaustriella thionipta]|nr:leucyl aminopeptidase [gamma proteobacterium symbiont of Bathyaustriella thionipta]